MNSDANNLITQKNHIASGGYPGYRLVATIRIDDQSRVIFASPAAANLLGVTVEQMMGSRLSQFFAEWQGDHSLPPELNYQLSQNTYGRAGRRFSDFSVTGLHAGGTKILLAGSITQEIYRGQLIETIIVRPPATRQRIQAELARSQDELCQLSAALQTIREDERTHISRELHDDLGQLLATLHMDLSLLQQNKSLNVSGHVLASGMRSTLIMAVESLRRIAGNLRPHALESGDLYRALYRLGDEFFSHHHIPCKIYANENDLRLDQSISTAIFRITQEALTNISRHAEAKSVIINISLIEDKLIMAIQDDGRGLKPEELQKAGSLGLIGMRERVLEMNGTIAVSSYDKSGTRIDIALSVAEHRRLP